MQHSTETGKSSRLLINPASQSTYPPKAWASQQFLSMGLVASRQVETHLNKRNMMGACGMKFAKLVFRTGGVPVAMLRK